MPGLRWEVPVRGIFKFSQFIKDYWMFIVAIPPVVGFVWAIVMGYFDFRALIPRISNCEAAICSMQDNLKSHDMQIESNRIRSEERMAGVESVMKSMDRKLNILIERRN